MGTQTLQLTEDQFYERFTIQPNHITGCEAYGGLYETYGKEKDYIKSMFLDERTNRRVWTIVEYASGTYILSGYKIINRIGYLITEELVLPGMEIEVKLDTEGIDDYDDFPM